MKSYSFVKKLGSNLGLITLSSSLIFGAGSQNVFAKGSFLESKLFKSLYGLFSDNDLKEFNTNDFWHNLFENKDDISEYLKEKNLVFLVKLKKFCDKKCSEEVPQNEEYRQRIKNLSDRIEIILNGNIEKKIDEFFKSEFFKKHVRTFTGGDIPEQNALIIEMLNVEEENYGALFFKFSTNLFVNAFCSTSAEDLEKTGYTRFHLILSLWEVNNISKEVLNNEYYVKNLEEEDYSCNFFYFRVFASDLVKFKIFKAEDVHKVFLAFAERENQDVKSINKESTIWYEKEDDFSKLIKGYSCYDLDFKKKLTRLQLSSPSLLDSASKYVEKTVAEPIRHVIYKALVEIFKEKSEKLNELSKNYIVKENPEKSAKSVLDRVFGENSEKASTDKIVEKVLEKLTKLTNEISGEKSVESVLYKVFRESLEETTID